MSPKSLKQTLLIASAALLTTSTALAAAQHSQTRQIDTSQYLDAKCNTGEPATYHFIPTSNASYKKKWLIVLSGGGSCTDEASCSARWLDDPAVPSTEDGEVGDHDNMAPRVKGRNFDDHGILDADGINGLGAAMNPFKDFNRVWVHYCSSDTWQGMGTTKTVDGDSSVLFPAMRGHAEQTQLVFAGARIVDAVVSIVMRGTVNGDGTQVLLDPANDIDLKMGGNGTPQTDFIPDGAEGEIVLAGSSAGGVGTLRNIDQVAYNVRQGVAASGSEPGYLGNPGIKVYGVSDAATAVGVQAEAAIDGSNGYDNATYYTAGDPANVRTDRDCVNNANNACYSIGSYVTKSQITTPYFIVMQAFDKNIHATLKTAIATMLAAVDAGLLTPAQANAVYPALFPINQAAYSSYGEAAEAYIRWRITVSADEIGGASNPAGLFIPNYAADFHQLMADSERFFSSPATIFGAVGDPNLGNYGGTTMNIPTALKNFRNCVLGSPANYAACVTTVNLTVGDSRVINSTAVY